MHEAKTQLSRLVRDIEMGAASEFVIARDGRPAARLVPLTPLQVDRQRRIGAAKGLFTVPDVVDGLDDQLQELFSRG
ncbi:MAG: prevent-host-death protein [Rubrivivax sp.]|nr:prevent-host-death protein [Rubrivivax sp.]